MTGSIWTRAALALLGVPARDQDDSVVAFTDQVEATPLCRIGVLGPGAGEVLPRLWARGYARAQAGRCGHPAPQDGEAPHDVVLVSGSYCAASALKSAANALGGLRADGQMVFELTAFERREDARALQAGLAGLGLRFQVALRPDMHLVAVKPAAATRQTSAAAAVVTGR